MPFETSVIVHASILYAMFLPSFERFGSFEEEDCDASLKTNLRSFWFIIQ